jgi:molybdate transport system ATP-binding protein
MSSLVVDARARAGTFELEARFSARPGVTVLFGPTASGKSLTLRLVAGIERASAGSIRKGDVVLDDAARTFVSPRARGVGYAPQDGALWPHRTALDHLTPFSSPSRAAELLALVGLERHAARRPARLSGGERQRLALARALARDADLLLLDEPFSALDDAARAKMGDLVRERASGGATVLFVTHDREEAARLGDAYVLFDNGRTTEAPSLILPPPAE